MTEDLINTLETLPCKSKNRRNLGSKPYTWPAMMPIEQKKGIIKVSTASSERAPVEIKNSQPGGTGGEPINVGLPSEFPAATRQFENTMMGPRRQVELWHAQHHVVLCMSPLLMIGYGWN